MPDCYSTYDWSRSYLLPDHVTANIPRRGGEGEPGAHNHARGLIVEICRATSAHPHALHYRIRPTQYRAHPHHRARQTPRTEPTTEDWSLSTLPALAGRDRRQLARALTRTSPSDSSVHATAGLG